MHPMEPTYAPCRSLLLHDFEEADVRFLLERLHAFEAAPGEPLLRAGSGLGSLTLLISGQAAVQIEGPPRVTLDVIGPGAWFGIDAFLAPQASARSVMANAPCVCAELRGHELDDLGRENTRAASVLLHLLCEQVSHEIIRAGGRSLVHDADGARLVAPEPAPRPDTWARIRALFNGLRRESEA